MKIKSDKIIFLIGVVVLFVFIFSNVVMGISNGPVNLNNPTDSQQDENERIVTETRKEIFAFETKTVDDDTVEYGKTVVKTKGEYGEKTYTYSVTYKGKTRISQDLVKEDITKQPVTEIIARGTKVVWHCVDATSYDRNPNNDNFCTNSIGEQRYVADCEAVALDPDYHPSQRGAPRYNGCAR